MKPVQNHRGVCKGQAVMLWRCLGGCEGSSARAPVAAPSSFSSVCGGDTFNTSLTNVGMKAWSQMHPQRDQACVLQPWVMWGKRKWFLKSNWNRKVESVWREELANACQNWLAFSRQLSCEFSVCVSSALSLWALWGRVWSKTYWIFPKPFLHAKAFSALMFKKARVRATVSHMRPYLFSL